MQPRLLLLAILFSLASLSTQAQNTFPSSGNVGIGTTTPQQRLHVEGTSNQGIFVSTTSLSTTSGSGVVGFTKALPTAAGQRLGYFLTGSRGGAQNGYVSAGMLGYAAGAWTGTSYPTYLTFETTPAGAAKRAERLRITADGNLGIGTASPVSRLSVSRSDGLAKLGRFTNASTTGDRSTLVEMQNGDGVLWRYGVGGTGSFSGPSNGEFYIARSKPSFIIDQEGQVNVGTQLYGNQRLSVFGEIRTTSYDESGSGIGGTGIITSAEYVGLQADGAEVAGVIATSINGNAIEGYLTGEDQGGYAGAFGGDVYATGLYQGSDRRLKQNIAEFSSALNVINKLQPKAYEYRHDGEYKWMHLPKGKHFGLVAQEVEEVLPDLVKNSKFDVGRVKSFGKFRRDGLQTQRGKPTSENIDFKAVNYTELIPIMVKAMQEQNAENKVKEERITALEKENRDIKQQLAELRTLITGKNLNVNTSGIYLQQNSPNPTRGNTSIRYGLPDGAMSATLLLINAKGQTLKTTAVNGRGNGQVNLNTASLPAGTYTYSLWVDGREAASKQLVIAK